MWLTRDRRLTVSGVDGRVLNSLGRPQYAPFRDWTLSPAGDLVAVAGGISRTVELWRVESGELIHSLPGQLDVDGIALSPDSRRIAAIGRVQGPEPLELRVWDAASGVELLRTRHQVPHPTGLHFSPDGRRLLAASGDRLLVWDAGARSRINSDPTPPK
jgi:WD40 repeat protein